MINTPSKPGPKLYSLKSLSSFKKSNRPLYIVATPLEELFFREFPLKFQHIFGHNHGRNTSTIVLRKKIKISREVLLRNLSAQLRSLKHHSFYTQSNDGSFIFFTKLKLVFFTSEKFCNGIDKEQKKTESLKPTNFLRKIECLFSPVSCVQRVK